MTRRTFFKSAVALAVCPVPVVKAAKPVSFEVQRQRIRDRIRRGVEVSRMSYQDLYRQLDSALGLEMSGQTFRIDDFKTLP